MIGSIDPNAMTETEQGLYVQGKLDLKDSEVAREAWRSVKANRVGLSIGYLTQTSHEDADGVTVLDAIDLFEVSIVPAPANADTRIISTKAMAPDPLGGAFTTRPRSQSPDPALVGTAFDPLTADGSPMRTSPLPTAKSIREPIRIESFEC